VSTEATKRRQTVTAPSRLADGHPADDPDAAPAECRDADPGLFFPEIGRSDQAADAKAICVRCPHLAACGEWAIPQDIYGIWGGLTQLDRSRIRSRRSRRAGAGQERAQ
jgi:WhiB family redox-sensing transcriptional regulator